MRSIFTSAAAAILLAGPALAAGAGEYPSYDFTSLFNTDFVVLIAFLLFLAILFYFGVPGMLGKMLDQRAEQIRSDIEEARALQEEAQSILNSFAAKQAQVEEQAQRIVAAAEEDALAAQKQAQEDLAASVARRLAAAEEQIASAEQAAAGRVRDGAVDLAVAAATRILSGQMSAAESNKLIDGSIDEVQARLN